MFQYIFWLHTHLGYTSNKMQRIVKVIKILKIFSLELMRQRLRLMAHLVGSIEQVTGKSRVATVVVVNPALYTTEKCDHQLHLVGRLQFKSNGVAVLLWIVHVQKVHSCHSHTIFLQFDVGTSCVITSTNGPTEDV